MRARRRRMRRSRGTSAGCEHAAGVHRRACGSRSARRTRGRGSRPRRRRRMRRPRRRASPTSSRAAASSPRVGSSTRSTSGCAASWMASTRQSRSPADRSRGCRAAVDLRRASEAWPRNRTNRSPVPWPAPRRSARRHSCATVVENSRSSNASGTSATARRRARRRSACTSDPATITVAGARGRAIACSRLDLPAPFGPRRATSSPARRVEGRRRRRRSRSPWRHREVRRPRAIGAPATARRSRHGRTLASRVGRRMHSAPSRSSSRTSTADPHSRIACSATTTHTPPSWASRASTPTTRSRAAASRSASGSSTSSSTGRVDDRRADRDQARLPRRERDDLAVEQVRDAEPLGDLGHPRAHDLRARRRASPARSRARRRRSRRRTTAARTARRRRRIRRSRAADGGAIGAADLDPAELLAVEHVLEQPAQGVQQRRLARSGRARDQRQRAGRQRRGRCPRASTGPSKPSDASRSTAGRSQTGSTGCARRTRAPPSRRPSATARSTVCSSTGTISDAAERSPRSSRATRTRRTESEQRRERRPGDHERPRHGPHRTAHGAAGEQRPQVDDHAQHAEREDQAGERQRADGRRAIAARRHVAEQRDVRERPGQRDARQVDDQDAVAARPAEHDAVDDPQQDEPRREQRRDPQ